MRQLVSLIAHIHERRQRSRYGEWQKRGVADPLRGKPHHGRACKQAAQQQAVRAFLLREIMGQMYLCLERACKACTNRQHSSRPTLGARQTFKID